jgi:hypothetical protein
MLEGSGCDGSLIGLSCIHHDSIGSRPSRLCNREQRRRRPPAYAHRVKIQDCPDAAERLARIQRMIEFYRLERHRRLMRLAMKMWRQTAREQQLARLDAAPDLIH